MSKQLSTSMTKYVGEIMDNRGGSEEDRLKLAELPGGRGQVRSGEPPALEFVKNICKIFELDKDVSSEVLVLKKSLLTQMGMHEYSSEAEWSNPCKEYVAEERGLAGLGGGRCV